MAALKTRLAALEKKWEASKPTMPLLTILAEKDSELTPDQLAEIAQAEKEGRKVMQFHIV